MDLSLPSRLVVLGGLGVFGLMVACDAVGEQDIVSQDIGFVQSAAPAAANRAGLTKGSQFFRGTVIASDPSIVPGDGAFEMFYTDLDVSTGRTVIAKATSADGSSWQTGWKAGGINGLVMAGRSGEWDENVESASVVRANGRWTLFFSGYRDKGDPFRGFPAALWMATSGDGATFTRVQSEPVMQPTKGWYDNEAIYSPTILYEDGIYHMIYVGHAYTDTSLIGTGGVFLLSATSTDGLTWTKAEQPIARPGQFGDWMSEGLAEPYLIRKAAGEYLLFFTGLHGENRAIGVASGPSVNGPWTFGTSPILQPGAGGNPDEHQVLAPAAVVEGDRLRMWYLAANKSEALTIGQAEGSATGVIDASK